MGLLNLFKKKKQLQFHNVYLKNICKDKNDLYIGKICNIVGDVTRNGNETYYLETYEGKKIGTFRDNDFKYCESYKYAIIYSISEKEIVVCIICNNVYPIALNIKSNFNLENGEVLKINKDGSLHDAQSNKFIGKIIDDRFNSLNLDNIALSQIDNNKLLTIIYK